MILFYFQNCLFYIPCTAGIPIITVCGVSPAEVLLASCHRFLYSSRCFHSYATALVDTGCDAGRVAGGTPCWCGGTLHHSQVTAKSPLSHQRQRRPYRAPGRNKVTAVGFEPTPLRNGALSHRLRPLGQTVLVVQDFQLRGH